MIPLVDLKIQCAQHRNAFLQALEGVLESTSFVLGKQLAEFEKRFAAYVGSAHAVGVASGTDALDLLLRAAGIAGGDEVITAVNPFFATSAAIDRPRARTAYPAAGPLPGVR